MTWIGKSEEVSMVKPLQISRQSVANNRIALTSSAEIRLRGSYTRHFPSRLSVSALAAVNRSRIGGLGNCPTGT